MSGEDTRTALKAAMVAGTLAIRATPKASRNAVQVEDGAVRVYVTCVAEDGKANKEIAKLLAKMLGIARTRLTLIKGKTSRDKVFRVDAG